ncbi:MAG: glycerate kinase [Planctomycetota bacterium]
MKIVLAPDSFKDAATATAACDAMAEGVRRVLPAAQTQSCPIADGGEGFAGTLALPLGLRPHHAESVDALGRPAVQKCFFAYPESEEAGQAEIATLDLAASAGLEQLGPDERDPLQTTTFGLGRMLRVAMQPAVREVILGIGGSATNDAGCGCAQALGVRFFDRDGHRMLRPITGGDLDRIATIDLDHRDPRLDQIDLRVACDVTNPLTGPNGAAHVYGPQKGASAADVQRLDAGLVHLAQVIREQFGIDVESIPGAGAAGGMGAGAVAFLDGTLSTGADLVLDALGFDDMISDADLVLTGEGRLDGQSLSGKAVMKIAQRAKKVDVPVIALVGAADEDAGRCLDAGLHGYEVLAPHLPAEESIARTTELLADAAERVVRQFANRNE